MTKPINQTQHDPVWDDSRITAYILEELPAEQRQLFEQEMASRPVLAAAVEEARQIVDDVSALYASETKPTLSDAHREELRQATTHRADAVDSAAPTAHGRDGSHGRYQFSGRQMLIAASVLFLIGLGSGLLLPALRESSRSVAFSVQTRDSGWGEEASSRRAADIPSRADETPQQSRQPASNFSQPTAERQALPADSSRSMPSTDLETAQPAGKRFSDAPASRPLATPTENEEFAERAQAYSGPTPYGIGQGMAGEMDGAMGGMGGGYESGEPFMAGPGGGKAAAGDVQMQKESASFADRKESYRRGAGGYGAEIDAGGFGMGGDADSKKSQVGQAVPNPAPDELAAATPSRRESDFYYDTALAGSRDESLVPPAAGAMTDEGRGPGMAGDQFQPITDNPFRRIEDHPLSTFSIDVDTASYAKVRSYLLQRGTLPRPDAVRIEELVNYFDYDYAPPAPPEADEESSDEPAPPFASHVEFAACPWKPEHRLARIGIKGKEIAREDRPAGNFVFLLDVSGSMNQPNKLPLVKQGMQMLLEQLNEDDRIAIVVYAGAAGLVLDSTPGDRIADVRDALERLQAGGSTNGGDGIQLAYNVARDHFIEGGVNRVILCTDGDFNVGTTGTDSLVRIVEEEAKGGVFLSVLGFGMGNHNDTMLEQISGRGNGNYAFIDTTDEAHKVLVEQVGGTLVTIAKDVKIQVEFNPAEIAAYRLIGYENRILAKEDFNDDTKDAGEIGAGHSVTALYELVPVGKTAEPIAPEVDPLRYQIPARESEVAQSGEWLTIKLRYKKPDGEKSRLVQFPAKDEGAEFAAATRDFQFAASVAGFGMQLRNSPYKGDWTLDAVEETAAAAIGDDPTSRRSEFLQMVQKAAELSGQ